MKKKQKREKKKLIEKAKSYIKGFSSKIVKDIRPTHIFLIILVLSFLCSIYVYSFPKKPEKPNGSYYIQSVYEIEILDRLHERNLSRIIIYPIEDFEIKKGTTTFRLDFPISLSGSKIENVYDIEVFYQLNDSDPTPIESTSKIDYVNRYFTTDINFPSLHLSIDNRLQISIEYYVERSGVGEDFSRDLFFLSSEPFVEKPANSSNFNILRVIYPNNFQFTCFKMKGIEIESMKEIETVDFKKYFIPGKKGDKLTLTGIFITPIISEKSMIPSISACFKETDNKLTWDQEAYLDEIYIEQQPTKYFCRKYYVTEIEAKFRNEANKGIKGIPDPIIYVLGKEKYDFKDAYTEKGSILSMAISSRGDFELHYFESEDMGIIVPSKSIEEIKILADIPNDLRLRGGSIDNEFDIALIVYNDNMIINYKYKLPKGSKLLLAYPTDYEDKNNTISWKRTETSEGDILLFFISFANGVQIPEDYYWIKSIYLIILPFFGIIIFFFSTNKKVPIGIRLSLVGLFFSFSFWKYWGEIDPLETPFLENSFDRLKLAFAQSYIPLICLYPFGLVLHSLWIKYFKKDSSE